MKVDPQEVTVVVLAGGRGRRMGGRDKGLVEIGGAALIEHVISIMAPQAGKLMINANRNAEAYRRYGYAVVSDSMSGFQGPLAGFASAMANADTPYVVTIPCDSPLLPDDLVQRLIDALHDGHAELAVAHDGERLQPVFALIDVRLLASLQRFLERGDRKIDLWYAGHKMALTDFSDSPNMFLNLNTPADEESLAQQLQPR